MLKNYIKGSNIIELVDESTNEGSTQSVTTVRIVGSQKDWSKLMVELLMSPDDDSDYIVSIRKEYFISDDNHPTFVWRILTWGDLFEAAAELGPILQGFQVEPTPRSTPTAPEAAEAPRPTAVQTKTYKTQDGTRTVSSIKLPFRRGRRDDPGTTKTLGKRGIGAFVSNVTADGGL